MPNEPEADDGPLLTLKEAVGLSIVVCGLLCLFAGTLGLQGFFAALVAMGLALIALGSGFLGFSSMRSGGTGGRQ
jgi:hypothetical protein